ncbi:membrane dipeptidase [Caulobacter sp. BK020]|uniref:dipeptidase n=1 Tax=Caulobacter sp. BK020 TaxID=2512117 RepID=UPI001045A6BD|nr:membrane dipeptidase [Caulobacter sp. BK020]TCS15342.1 membrane dipeptidase [Caulobacter sp. BK020]
MTKLFLLASAAVLALSDPAAALAAQPDAAAIHARALVLDSHVDVPLDLGVGPHEAGVDGDGQIDLPKLERGQVDAAVLAAFVPQGPRTPEGYAKARADADTKLAAIRAIAERHPDRAVLALSAADVEAAAKAGKRAIIVGFLNAYPFGESLEPIDAYYRAGVRSFGFVHAGNNAYADSSRPSGAGPKVEWGGLSTLGKAAVGKLNDLGIIIDVSQLTPDGVFQTLKLSRAPVVASHSGVQGAVDAPRNLSDAELDAIEANGGVVQIVAFGPYLVKPGPDFAAKVAPIRVQFGLPAAYAKTSDGTETLTPEKRTDYSHAINALLPKATVQDLIVSVDYAVKRIGIDHVGLSSDFNHGGGVVGWTNEGEAANVTAELVRHGYSEADIGKLWGGNYLRVFKAVETEAKR